MTAQATEVSAPVVVRLKECDLCKTPIRIVLNDEREVSYDISTGDEHDCWVLPDDADVLVISDPNGDCECGP